MLSLGGTGMVSQDNTLAFPSCQKGGGFRGVVANSHQQNTLGVTAGASDRDGPRPELGFQCQTVNVSLGNGHGDSGTSQLFKCRCWRSLGSLFVRSEEHTSELQSRPHLVCR